MARLLHVHWHEAESAALAAPLAAAGHEVLAHWSTGEHLRLGAFQPDAVIISLDRLPSHGRQIAAWWGEAKKRQGIPVVFVGGQEEKVALAREQFPRAAFCGHAELPLVLERLLAATARAAPVRRSRKTTGSGGT